MEGLETIVGERISFRPFRNDDAKIYASWLEDDDLCMIVNEKKRNPEEVKEYQKSLTKDPKFIEYIVIDNKTGKPIGDICLNLENKNSAGLKPTWGLMLGESEYRKKGYGSEALALLFDYAKKKLGLKKIYGEVFPSNKEGLKFHTSFGLRTEKEVIDRDGKECYLFVKDLDRLS